MPLKKCTLNGKDIRSLADLYDQLSSQLSFSAHFGRNLDALWDVLSADMEGPFEIEWKRANESKKTMGKDFERAVKLLQELQEERDDFKLKMEK